MADEPKRVKQIIVKRDLCIGAASCVINAPGVFELDPENKAIIKQLGNVKNSGPSDRSRLEDTAVTDESITNAAQSCPTKAILLFDDSGKQLYP